MLVGLLPSKDPKEDRTIVDPFPIVRPLVLVRALRVKFRVEAMITVELIVAAEAPGRLIVRVPIVLAEGENESVPTDVEKGPLITSVDAAFGDSVPVP